MTVDTAVNAEGEKCGMNVMTTSCEDRPPSSVGGGGECNVDGKDDYVFVNGSDAASDDHDHGNAEGNEEELNVSASNGEGVGVNASGGDQLEACNGYNGKLDNVVKLDGGESKLENGVVVGEESDGKVEGGESVKANVEIKLESEDVIDDGKLVGKSNDVDGEDDDVEVRDKESVKETDVDDKVKDGDSGVEKEDEADASVDGIGYPSVDDDDKGTNLSGVDSGTVMVQNGTSVLEAEPQAPHVEAEEQLQLGRSEEDEGQPTEGEKVEEGVIESEVEDSINCHTDADKVLVTDSESVDGVVKEPKPLEEVLKHESQEEGTIGSQLPDGNFKAPDSEVDESLLDDVVTEKQSQQQDQQLGDSREPDSVEAEAEARELSDSGVLELSGNQDLNSVDSEAATCELQQSGESEVKNQYASGLTTESEECQDLQTFSMSEGAVNQSNVSQDLKSADSEAATCELQQSGESEVKDRYATGLTTESKECQDSQTFPVSEGAVNQSYVELSGSQELNSVDSEAGTSELQQSGISEVTDQYATGLTTESEECQDSETFPVSEGAVNQSNVESMASEVDMTAHKSIDQSDEAATDETEEVMGNPETSTVDLQSDNSVEPVVDRELDGVHGEQKAGSFAQLGECLDSSVQNVSLQDQVSEETAVVDVMEKEASSEDLPAEKTIIVEEATKLPAPKFSTEAAIDDEDRDLDASHLGDCGAVDEVHVPESSYDSGKCLRPEDSDLTAAVSNEVDLSVPCDSDLREGTTVEEGSFVGDTSISPSTDDTCSQSKLENSSIALPSADGIESEAKTAIGDVDVAPSNPKISFGSFECSAHFSPSESITVHPHVMNRSINFSTSQSGFVGNSKPTGIADGVTSLKSEANDAHPTESNHDKVCVRTEEVSATPLEVSGNNSLAGQDVNPDLVRQPFYYLVKVPRFDDVTLSEDIKISDSELREKTEYRDAVRIKYQKYKASFWESKSNFEAAKSEERAAYKLMMAKKREMDSAQSLLNLARNAMTVDDVDSRIRNIEHKMEHETLILAEEKKLLHEIRQLKQQREQLASNPRRQQEIQQALDQRVETEEHLKVLRKEIDALKDNHVKAEEKAKALKKKYDEESGLLDDLRTQYNSADTIRQKAYVQLQTLKKQAYEKNKLFYHYKEAAKVAFDLAAAGKLDSLEQHCVSQAEKLMELWNNNDEFRKEYIRCNERSTLKRLKTKDGRAFGPGEEPPFLGNFSDYREKSVAKFNSVGTVPTLERDFPLAAKIALEEPSKKVTEQKNKTSLGKKRVETTSKDSIAEPSGRVEIEEKVEEVHKPTKEEEELERQKEQKRREEEEERKKVEAARLKEQRRMEEIAKAQEAQLRKKKMAEKAQARAEARARKEAEEKLKEKEKRAKKKEKKKGIVSEITETEPAQQPESSSETVREPEVTEKPVTVTKKSHKPALYTKQVKTTKSISAPPAPLRNRAKRRIPQWVWWFAVTILSVILIFPLGNKDIGGLFKHFTSGSSY